MICEGDDDLNLLSWLRDRAGIAALQIAKLDGIDPLAKRVQVLIKGIPGAVAPPSVGLVLDADHDPRSRREAAHAALVRAAPTSRHGIYLFPDNEATGMLEDLYLSACRFPALASCARSYVTCAKAHHPTGFNESKVGYEAYRAIVRPTQRAVQHGLSEGDVNPAHPTLVPLIEFMRDLASLP